MSSAEETSWPSTSALVLLAPWYRCPAMFCSALWALPPWAQVLPLAVLLPRGVCITMSMFSRSPISYSDYTDISTSDKITMWILPHDLRENIYTQGWILLACLIGTEVLSMVAPARFLTVWPLSRLTKMDHAAHLGGYLAGAGCGWTLGQKRRAERAQRARDSRWLKNLSR